MAINSGEKIEYSTLHGELGGGKYIKPKKLTLEPPINAQLRLMSNSFFDMSILQGRLFQSWQLAQLNVHNFIPFATRHNKKHFVLSLRDI